MDTTQKSIAEQIVLVLSKLKPTDESRFNDTYLYKLINQAREEAINADYKVTAVIDPAWMQDLGMVDFHRVNFADDISITSNACDVSKAFLPQMITLEAGNGNQDLGVNILSANGKTAYYPMALALWRNIPAEHEASMFKYFSRMNTSLYVNHLVTKLRVYGLLQNPEDAAIINSEPILSGSIANGTTYIVKFGQIIYDGSTYRENTTFVGTATTTFAGTGKSYLNSQVTAFTEFDPYPVTGDMARKIVLDILVKEFGIERQAIPDLQNDSRDDATKVKI
jgi:hypothetical protein